MGEETWMIFIGEDLENGREHRPARFTHRQRHGPATGLQQPHPSQSLHQRKRPHRLKQHNQREHNHPQHPSTQNIDHRR